MAGLARPTLRCLRGDLALTVPRADTPLEDISHPLLARAAERFADDQTPYERIAAIDDEVLFKVSGTGTLQRRALPAADSRLWNPAESADTVRDPCWQCPDLTWDRSLGFPGRDRRAMRLIVPSLPGLPGTGGANP